MRNIIIVLSLLWPAAASAQTISTMAARITSDLKPESRIAITEFVYSDGRDSSGPSLIQERITGEIVRRHRATVIERTFLSRVMAELHLQSTGIMDEATVKRVGKILGADAIVVGVLNDVAGGKTEIHARLVNVETGTVMSEGSAVVSRVWSDTKPVVAKAAKPKSAEEYMNNRLAEVNKSLAGATVSGDKLVVDGVAVTAQQFSDGATQAILGDTKAAGYKLPEGVR